MDLGSVLITSFLGPVVKSIFMNHKCKCTSSHNFTHPEYRYFFNMIISLLYLQVVHKVPLVLVHLVLLSHPKYKGITWIIEYTLTLKCISLKKTTKIKVNMYYIISIKKVNIDLTMSPFGPAGPAGPGGPSVPCKKRCCHVIRLYRYFKITLIFQTNKRWKAKIK